MLIYALLPIGVFYGLLLQRLIAKINCGQLKEERFISRNNITLILSFFILLSLAVFKSVTVGTDSSMYYRFFKTSNYEIFEPGIFLIYHIADTYNHYLIFLVFVYSIFLFFMMKGIKKHCPNYLISILFFLLTFVYLTSFNQIRQLIAASLLFCFINYVLTKKDSYKFITIIFIALLFHRSAIFLLVLLIIPKSKIKFKYILSLFLFTIIIYFFPQFKNEVGNLIIQFSGFYAEKYEINLGQFFLVNKEKGLLELMPVVFQMMIVIFTYFYSSRNTNLRINYRLFNVCFNILIINLTLYSVSGIEAIDRIQVYFSVFNIYFYSLLFHQLLNDRNYLLGKLVPCIILVFWLVYYFVRIFNNNQGIVPYAFFN